MAPMALTPTTESTPSSKMPSSSPSSLLAPAHMHKNINEPLNTTDYNAANLAMPTNFRAMMNSGSLLLGASTRYPSADAARVIATLPHHFCFIDAEHMPVDATTLTHMIRTINFVSAGRMVPVVRIPETATHLVAYALNAGAGGIVMPHVRNAEQAKQLVDLCRFPPNGHRGHPPATLFGHERATKDPSQTVCDVWDDHICVICQIEDADGVENIEEICAVPGVDALMVGTHDLRLELGTTPRVTFDGEEPQFIRALEKITNAAAKHGPNGMAILGLSLMGSDFPKRVQRGWRAFIISIDAHMIHEHGKKDFAKAVAVTKHTTNPVPITKTANGTFRDEYSLANIGDHPLKKASYLPLNGDALVSAAVFEEPKFV